MGRRSWRDLLMLWWPRLLPGLAASATHGVIRTAHAVRSLQAAGDVPDPLLVDELAQGLGIAGRLVSLRHLDALPAALDEWGPPAPPDAALDDLIAASARVLAARDDAPIAFCHAVTAPAAARLVLPELSPELQRASVSARWQVVGAIIAAFASPRDALERLAAEADADALLAELDGRAIEHGDEHVIKLTEAAEREFARTGDVTLLVAADRFRGRVSAG